MYETRRRGGRRPLPFAPTQSIRQQALAAAQEQGTGSRRIRKKQAGPGFSSSEEGRLPRTNPATSCVPLLSAVVNGRRTGAGGLRRQERLNSRSALPNRGEERARGTPERARSRRARTQSPSMPKPAVSPPSDPGRSRNLGHPAGLRPSALWSPLSGRLGSYALRSCETRTSPHQPRIGAGWASCAHPAPTPRRTILELPHGRRRGRSNHSCPLRQRSRCGLPPS